VLKRGDELALDIADGRHAWIQLISGSLDVNSEKLNAGDGAAISAETRLRIKASDDNSEFLLFDLK
jgi:redox-sensitive bicupin YhaK (pirin superfamily)